VDLVIRVALYTRVSTDEQAKEGFSLASQSTRLRAYALAQGWEVAAEYMDDGHSGRTAKRPAYIQAMQERDRWDVLLVLKMDRIHRNSKNFMQMMEDLKRFGKEFASVTESLDTGSAMGRFVMDIIQRIAQLESEVIGERALDGMTQKAKEGSGGLGGPAPYGYRWEDSKLVIVPEEADLVRTIFTARHELRHSISRIADNLARQGKRTRNGVSWTYWSVKDILKREEVYLGHLRWNGILQQNAHEPILTRVP